MNQIFQLRYYEALQAKVFPNWGWNPDLTKAHDNFTWKWQSNPTYFWLLTSTAYNAKNWHWMSYSASFEQSDLYLFGGSSSRQYFWNTMLHPKATPFCYINGKKSKLLERHLSDVSQKSGIFNVYCHFSRQKTNLIFLKTTQMRRKTFIDWIFHFIYL